MLEVRYDKSCTSHPSPTSAPLSLLLLYYCSELRFEKFKCFHFTMIHSNMTFYVITVVKMSILVFWNIMPCGLLDGYRRNSIGDGDSTFVWNVSIPRSPTSTLVLVIGRILSRDQYIVQVEGLQQRSNLKSAPAWRMGQLPSLYHEWSHKVQIMIRFWRSGWINLTKFLRNKFYRHVLVVPPVVTNEDFEDKEQRQSTHPM